MRRGLQFGLGTETPTPARRMPVVHGPAESGGVDATPGAQGESNKFSCPLSESSAESVYFV